MFGRTTGCIDQLTEVERAAIVTLHKTGWIGRDIAEVIKCSEKSVSVWVRRWQEEHSVKDAERSGRPRCTTDDIDQEIGLLADKKPILTPKDIKRELRLPVSAHTISRRLDEVGLFGRVQPHHHADRCSAHQRKELRRKEQRAAVTGRHQYMSF